MFEIYQEVYITRDLPAEGLQIGDLATLIDWLEHPSGGEKGAILEVFNAIGETIAVISVPISAIEPLRADQIPTVRTLNQSA